MTRPRRTIGALTLGVLLLGVAVAPSAFATRPSAAPTPTRAACEAFADYFQIEYLVAFASAFGSLDPKQDGRDTEAQIRDTFHLILSPRLERITETLAAGTGPPARRLFVQQRKAYAKGVALLEDVGLTTEQIAKLAEVDLGPDTDLQQVLGDVQLDRAALDRAVKKFGAATASLDLNAATKAEQESFRDAGIACGVFPTTVRCDEIVTPAEARALLGGRAKSTDEDGTCTSTVPAKTPGADDAVLAVDVYDSSLTFDVLTATTQGQSLDGVGDAAVTLGGFNSFASVKTCGRTIIAKQGERTVVVAACTGTDAPTDEQLGSIASSVFERLPAAG